MENARSLASRFSGLLLFLLSLAVVGVLVYLTIQSANDSNTTENGDAQPAENQLDQEGVTNEDEQGSSSQDSNSSSSNNASATPTTGGNEDGEVAATTDGEPLPNTGPESAVAGAIALGALAFAGNAYLNSRRELAKLTGR